MSSTLPLRESNAALDGKEANPLATASTADDVHNALKALHQREAALVARLDEISPRRNNHAYQQDQQLGRELGRLDALRTSLGGQVIAARAVANEMLAGPAETAGRLSARVRGLDLEQSRVGAALRVVEQVAELKACVHGVVGSMGAPQDWEAAAGYLARAAKRVPDEIVRSGFAAAAVPTVEVPDAPWVTLDNARESLCGLFLREFETAAKEDDGQKVTRFFKLFPLIGRADVGLDVYGRYVCQGVAGTARETLKTAKKEGFFFANALTRLFEHIASIVEGHGPLVERHYGVGRMVRVVERLQAEADVQGGIIIDSWADERVVERRLTDVKSYPFSFLVQSFHQQPGVPPRVASPRTLPRVASPRVGSPATVERRSEDEEGVNMKEVDGLLTEMAVMLGRWALYTRFIGGKCRPLDSQHPLMVPEIVTKSNLFRKVSSKLATPYTVMMTFFFRRSVEKAFQLDESPAASLSLNQRAAPEMPQPPYIISAVDVTMYIVSTVLQRTLATCQRDVVGAVVPTIGRVLGSDFIGMIQRRMRDEAYPKPTSRGGLPPDDKVIAFIVLINSLELSNEYLGRVIKGVLPSNDEEQDPSHQQNLADSFPFEGDVAFVTTTIRNLESSFLSKTNALLTEAIQVLFNQAVKPRLRHIVADAFRDADYSLDEQALDDLVARHQLDDPDAPDTSTVLASVERRFESGWDTLVRPIARILTPGPMAQLLDAAAHQLARILEARLWAQVNRASPFGAVRLERDIGAIVGTVAGGNYAMREVFSRALQVLMVANMDEDEWEEVVLQEGAEEGEMLWVLTEDERRKARALVRV